MSKKDESVKRKASGLVAEFKEFALRGSLIDMAVGLVIGGAMTAIVKSIIDGLLMPFVAFLLGGADFSGLKTQLGGADSETFLLWGDVISAVIQFFCIALIVFLIVKGINRLRRKKDEEAPAPEPPTRSEELLSEILAELKSKN